MQANLIDFDKCIVSYPARGMAWHWINDKVANDCVQQLELGAGLFSKEVLTNFGHFE